MTDHRALAALGALVLTAVFAVGTIVGSFVLAPWPELILAAAAVLIPIGTLAFAILMPYLVGIRPQPCPRCGKPARLWQDRCAGCGADHPQSLLISHYAPKQPPADMPAPVRRVRLPARLPPTAQGRPIPKPRQRPVFSLRTLLGINAALAVVFALAHLATARSAGLELAVAPCVWLLGAAGTIVLAVLGDACGRRAGSLVGAVLGSVIWSAGLILLLRQMPDCPGLRDSLGIHILAILTTSAGCVWSVWRYDQQTEQPEGAPDVTLPRLLRGHRERLESLRRRYDSQLVDEAAEESADA